jgi:hypothetical protein
MQHELSFNMSEASSKRWFLLFAAVVIGALFIDPFLSLSICRATLLAIWVGSLFGWCRDRS